MRKPIIGVLPLIDTQKESIWMLPGYLEGIEAKGGVPFILPFTDSKEELDCLLPLCDGFLLTGGQDVNPKLYHEQMIKECDEIIDKLDNEFKYVFDYAYNEDKAILGICRGCQIINIFMQGNMYQDLPTQHPSTIAHHQERPYVKTSHFVTIKENSYLYDLLNVTQLEVNSIHHQAIKDVGKNLEVQAIALDGIIESIKVKDKKFILGVQWHPEYNFKQNKYSEKLFEAFIANCL